MFVMEKFDKGAIDAELAQGFPLKHRWHNRFHLEMPFGLINDPNGLTYHDGAYHIFYQWNPLGCEHKNKCWAHVKTRDFVHYTLPELALWPDDVHDKDGCYSGCGLSQDGKLRVLYTCNRKEDGVRIPAQRFGTLQDDGSVRKEEIIIPDHPEGITGHFRDPFLFERRGHRYLVIGAQREENETGTVLVYEEREDGWHNRGEVHTRLGDFGYMWECPNLLQFGSYDVLVFCPQGLAAREYDRQNIYQAGYIAGHLSLDSMDMMQHTKFQELDRGFDFYAPQVFEHEGRHLLLGTLAQEDCDAVCQKYNLIRKVERRVLIFHILQTDSTRTYDMLKDITPLENSDILVEIDRHTVALIKEIADNETLDEAVQFAQALQETLMSETARTMTVGIGNGVSDLYELKDSYMEARRAIEVGRTFAPRDYIYAYSHLMLERFLVELPENIAESYLRVLFSPRTEKVLSKDIMDTIDTFFRKDLNLSDTARQLYIHRNTLVYRLDKVYRHTGLDLRKFDDAVTFRIFMELKKRRRKEEQER